MWYKVNTQNLPEFSQFMGREIFYIYVPDKEKIYVVSEIYNRLSALYYPEFKIAWANSWDGASQKLKIEQTDFVATRDVDKLLRVYAGIDYVKEENEYCFVMPTISLFLLIIAILWLLYSIITYHYLVSNKKK